MSALHLLLPGCDAHEHHSIDLACAPERAIKLALCAPAAPDALSRTLLRLRGLSAAGTIAGLVDSMRFETLHEAPCEIVFGASSRPWRPSGAIGPFAGAGHGTVRMALDLRAVSRPGGCTLSTETRVAAVDDAARVAFLRYWRIIGPFSAVLRRRWLRAVEREVSAAAE